MRARIPALVLFGLVATLSGGCITGMVNGEALQPHSEFSIMPADVSLEAETLLIPVDGAVLHAWVFGARLGKPLVIGAIGNTGNKQLLLPLVNPCLAAGQAVVLYDYRGFGLSSGEPDLFEMVDDARAVLDAVHDEYQPSFVTLYAPSLGSLGVIGLAADEPERVNAVVLDSMIDPNAKIRVLFGGLLGPVVWTLFVPGEFDSEHNIGRLSQPALLLHGANDRLTPLVETAPVLEAARQSPGGADFWIAEDAGHAPGLQGAYPGTYHSRMASFLWNAQAGRTRSFSWDWSSREIGEQGWAVDLDVRAAQPQSLKVFVQSDGLQTFQMLTVGPGHKVITLPCDARPLHVFCWADTGLDVDRLLGEGRKQLLASLQEAVGDKLSIRACQELSESLDEVRSLYGESIRTHLVKPYAVLGMMEQKHGMPDEALRSYRHALECLPQKPAAHIQFKDAAWDIGFDVTIDMLADRLDVLASEHEQASDLLLRIDSIRASADERQLRLRAYIDAERALVLAASKTR